jgi:hypothetical protein
MDMSNPTFLSWVEGDVRREREAQTDKWGEQNHPDGTGPEYGIGQDQAHAWREVCQLAAANGTLTWRHVIQEEFFEALAEEDPDKLRTELIQVAAVAMTWVEAIDRRKAKEKHDAQLRINLMSAGKFKEAEELRDGQ